MAVRIGDVAPDFEQDSTEGRIKFHDFIGDKWVVLFSHPKDFTPVCTTELGYLAKLKPEFDKRNTKVIGLSVDGVVDHRKWSKDIEETQGAKAELSPAGRCRPQGLRSLRHDPPECERHADRAVGVRHRTGQEVDIERKDGSRSLIVPNIKNANKLNFHEFWNAYEDLISRSRKGTIDPNEFLGTTITLTNPGTIGTVASVPRLMVGQGTIIATGAIQYNAEYQAMSQTTISTLGISKTMNITSTYDHRIIQGAESGLFLKTINDLLLGQDDYYDDIFESLRLPFKPLRWQTDYQPGIFESAANTEEIVKQAKVLQLINLFIVRGHLIADLDPLGSKTQHHVELDPSSYNLTIWIWRPQHPTMSPAHREPRTPRQPLS